VCLPASLAMTDDGIVSAERTPPQSYPMQDDPETEFDSNAR